MRISDWSSDVCSSDLIGSGRICRADVALLRQFIGNEIGILGKFMAAAELRIISHHGEALPLGGRQLLDARYIGAKGTRAACKLQKGGCGGRNDCAFSAQTHTCHPVPASVRLLMWD